MSPPVDYVAAARRHLADARCLLASQRPANAGQLFGFSVECGVKAMLLACGVPPGADGGLPEQNRLRTHLPRLANVIVSSGHLIPDGRKATAYMAMLPGLNALADWSIDHRYWSESAIPLTSLPAWQQAAQEANAMLDQVVLDGAP